MIENNTKTSVLPGTQICLQDTLNKRIAGLVIQFLFTILFIEKIGDPLYGIWELYRKLLSSV